MPFSKKTTRGRSTVDSIRPRPPMTFFFSFRLRLRLARQRQRRIQITGEYLRIVTSMRVARSRNVATNQLAKSELFDDDFVHSCVLRLNL